MADDVAAIDAAARAAGYPLRPGVVDQMLGREGRVKTVWRPLAEAHARAGAAGWGEIAADARRYLREAGLAFNPYEDGGLKGGAEPAFDAVPLIMSRDEFAVLAAGAEQRARMIDAVLGDLYGRRGLVMAGALPPEVVFGAPGLVRAAEGWDRPPRRRLTRYAVDVARLADGRWVTLADHVDRPEGEGWALANRVAFGQSAADLFVDSGVRRLASHFDALSQALDAETGAEGRVAFVTPGPADPSYFSHAYLARYLGLSLVEPGDLAVRDGEAFVKTLEGLRRVDVILRGAGSAGIDPLYAPGPGFGGPPAALRAARLGRLAFVNAVGGGVADGRAMAPFSTDLAQRLTGEELVLGEAEHLWLGEAHAQARWLEEREAWRVAPLWAPGAAAPAELAAMGREAAERWLARVGWRWIALRAADTARTPVDGGGRLRDAAFAVRLFVVAGHDGWRCMPGGLAFAAPPETAALDAMPWRGVAKDVWVVDEQPTADGSGAVARLGVRRRTAHLRRTGRDLLSRVADDLFWLGRYAEQADHTLRVLKVVIERLVDAPRRDADPALLHRLLDLRLSEDGAGRDRAVLRARIARLALDREEPFGAPAAIDALYANAHRARAHLSRDAWRDVVALHSAPAWRAAPAPSRALALAGAVETGVRQIAAFTGACHENMTRNFAWRFIELGRRIQRGLHLVQLFRAMVVDAAEDDMGLYYAVLLICDSFYAYRARYLITPEATPTVDLLMLDESNPRSLAFQVAAIVRVLEDLPRATPYRNPEHRIALRLQTALQTAEAPPLGEPDGDGRRAALAALLEDAETGLNAVADLVAKAYFAHAEPTLTEVLAARREPV